MKWLRSTTVTGLPVWRARGRRAVYSIEQRNGMWWLAGRDEDRLGLLCFPVDGQPFRLVEDAQRAAERVDRTGVQVGEMSGC